MEITDPKHTKERMDKWIERMNNICERCGGETKSQFRTLCEKCLRELENGIEFPKTNADRIRTMTDEELTMFLAETSRCSEWCNLYEKCKTKPHDSYSVCLETWYEWLKQKATDKDGAE